VRLQHQPGHGLGSLRSLNVTFARRHDGSLHQDVPGMGKGAGMAETCLLGQAAHELADVLKMADACPAGGFAGARHYHRTSCPVSLADCVAAEVARSRDQSLGTADPHLLDVCHREGIAMDVLPGSSGSRWTPTTA